MNDLVRKLLIWSSVLVLCHLITPAPGLAKEKSRSNLQSSSKIMIKKQAVLVDADGYRLVSTDSKLKCRETLRGNLDCIE